MNAGTVSGDCFLTAAAVEYAEACRLELQRQELLLTALQLTFAVAAPLRPLREKAVAVST
jgi:hypothetical protein